MKTITVGELIKQLRRHPDHTPVFTTNGQYKPMREILGAKLHAYAECIFIEGGELADELPVASAGGKTEKPARKPNKPRGKTGRKKKSAAKNNTHPFIICPNKDCLNGEVEDNGPRACPTCGGNATIDNPDYIPHVASAEQADSIGNNDDKGNNDQQGPVDYINACVCLAGHRKCNGDCARQPFGGPLK